MYEVNGKRLFKAIALLEAQSIYLKDHVEGSDQILSRRNKKRVEDFLNKLKSELIQLKVNVPLKIADDALGALKNDNLTYQNWQRATEDIQKTLQYEIEEIALYVVDNSHAAFLKIDARPFGDLDMSNFGAAAQEVSEAARCLALRRNKASVFHLMLAMEEVVQTLAARGATTHDDKGRWLTWLKLAHNIDNQIIKPLPDGAEKTAWHNACSMLKSVGYAWRNPTDHPGASYSFEDAMEIFSSVKQFMTALVRVVEREQSA